MTVMTATAARTNLYKLIDQTRDYYEPIIISGKRNNAVLISEDDWNAIQETLYLCSIPGRGNRSLKQVKSHWKSIIAVFLLKVWYNRNTEEIEMADIVYSYFDQLDSLELPDLEMLSEKINALIFYKKNTNDASVEKGVSFFNSLKGSVKYKIDAEKELFQALDEKYAYSH